MRMFAYANEVFFSRAGKRGEKGKELEIKRGNLGVFEAVVLKKLKALF